MTTNFKGVLLWAQTKPYEVFFSVLALLVFSPVITVLGGSMLAETSETLGFPWNIIVIYLATLASLFIILNLGDQKTDAKTLFWAWVLFSALLTVLAGIGYLEMLVFGWAPIMHICKCV